VAAAAGLCAWAISIETLRLVGHLLPLTVVPDVQVLAVALLVPLVVTAIAGLAPAWRVTGLDLIAGLRLGTRVGGRSRRRG
jgi:hypothetical protein